MMKKSLAGILLALGLLAIALAGCSQAQTGVATDTTGTTATTAPVETTEATEPIDYTQYYGPWAFSVTEKAREDQKLHYYFMSNEGIVRETGYSDGSTTLKWGDSCLVVFPNGQTMLIDSGTYWYAPVLLGNLERMGVDRLDYLVITHPHSDHYGGAFGTKTKTTEFLDKISVAQVYYREASDPVAEEETNLVKNICAEKNIPVDFWEQGDSLTVGEVQISALWPVVGTSETIISGTPNVNNSSIVMRIEFGEHSSLFTGDLYSGGELLSLTSGNVETFDVDLLKVPHHGHKTSSSDVFLDATSPELAIATGSINISNEVRQRYEDHQIPLMYNYINGYIHVAVGADGIMETDSTRNDTPDAVVEEEAID